MTGIPDPAKASFIISLTDNPSHRRAADNLATVIVWVEGLRAWEGTHVFAAEPLPPNESRQAFVRVDMRTGAVTEL